MEFSHEPKDTFSVHLKSRRKAPQASRGAPESPAGCSPRGPKSRSLLIPEFLQRIGQLRRILHPDRIPFFAQQ